MPTTVTKYGKEIGKFLGQTTLNSTNPLYNRRSRKGIVKERRGTITRISVGRETMKQRLFACDIIQFTWDETYKRIHDPKRLKMLLQSIQHTWEFIHIFSLTTAWEKLQTPESSSTSLREGEAGYTSSRLTCPKYKTCPGLLTTHCSIPAQNQLEYWRNVYQLGLLLSLDVRG